MSSILFLIVPFTSSSFPLALSMLPSAFFSGSSVISPHAFLARPFVSSHLPFSLSSSPIGMVLPPCPSRWGRRGRTGTPLAAILEGLERPSDPPLDLQPHLPGRLDGLGERLRDL